MRVVFAAFIIFSLVYMCLHGFMKIDKAHGMNFSGRHWGLLLCSSLIAAFFWSNMAEEFTLTAAACWLIVHVYFLCCTMTDIVVCQVYDLLQYPAILAAGYLALSGSGNVFTGSSIIFFAVLQRLVFMRFYGSADGMAFMVAALAESSLGYDIEMYLLHMIVAYLLLGVTQGIRGNIGLKGRLKKPVPFLPYITISFWGIIWAAENYSKITHFIERKDVVYLLAKLW